MCTGACIGVATGIFGAIKTIAPLMTAASGLLTLFGGKPKGPPAPTMPAAPAGMVSRDRAQVLLGSDAINARVGGKSPLAGSGATSSGDILGGLGRGGLAL